MEGYTWQHETNLLDGNVLNRQRFIIWNFMEQESQFLLLLCQFSGNRFWSAVAKGDMSYNTPIILH